MYYFVISFAIFIHFLLLQFHLLRNNFLLLYNTNTRVPIAYVCLFVCACICVSVSAREFMLANMEGGAKRRGRLERTNYSLNFPDLSYVNFCKKSCKKFVLNRKYIKLIKLKFLMTH